MSKTIWAICAASLCIVSCGRTETQSSTKEAWNPQNDPLLLGMSFERRLSSLPQNGRLKDRNLPWSDSYWPNKKAGLALRWKAQEPHGFSYSVYRPGDLRGIDKQRLSRLSPAEKYDIFMNRFDFPTVASERKRTQRDAPEWTGICHGWAAAALLYVEPRPVDVTGVNGITIPFGSSDVKALLSYYVGQVKANEGSASVGVRCNAESRSENTPECRDINPGTFHIVLTNQVGLRKDGVIMDITRGKEIWNHPIFEYESRAGMERRPSPYASPQAVREVHYETTVWFAREIEARWEPVLGTGAQQDGWKQYRYWLELNARGEIVGGSWATQDHPDFLWTAGRRPHFSDYWSGLDRIYQASR